MRLLLRFVLNTAAFAAGGLVAAFEWPRATRRSDPVSSLAGSRCQYRPGKGRVESRPHALRDSRGRTNCFRGGAQDGIPATPSSGAPGHGRFVGNPGPCERGVRRSQRPRQTVPVRRNSAPGHEHGQVCLNSDPAATEDQPTSRATTRAAIWSIRRSPIRDKGSNDLHRRAAFPLRSSSSMGRRRGTGPSSATFGAVAGHLRVGAGRTAP